jgi:hypothetical protein
MGCVMKGFRGSCVGLFCMQVSRRIPHLLTYFFLFPFSRKPTRRFIKKGEHTIPTMIQIVKAIYRNTKAIKD